MNMFADRVQAGQTLADLLDEYVGQQNVLVLALPRGGVPVAYQISKKLNAPLDVCLVRKLGVPGHEELAMGAIAYGQDRVLQVLNQEVIDSHQISTETIQAVMEREQQELLRRNARYRQDRKPPAITDHTVLLVDDGVATGATMRAAMAAISSAKPSQLVVAVPVADPMVCNALSKAADQVVCPLQPDPVHSVGSWYESFPQVTDKEVIELLQTNTL